LHCKKYTIVGRSGRTKTCSRINNENDDEGQLEKEGGRDKCWYKKASTTKSNSGGR
jgi:hypothetical protein